MKETTLFGYKILEDGTILKLNGKPMAFHKTIQLLINGELKSVSYARIVYYAFNQDNFDFFNHSYCVKHKDNNYRNNNLSNLYLSNKKDYLWGNKHKKSKLTDDEVKKIRQLYFIGEKDSKENGQDLNNPNKKYSYRKLADKFGVSHGLIRQIIKGECRKSAKDKEVMNNA